MKELFRKGFIILVAFLAIFVFIQFVYAHPLPYSCDVRILSIEIEKVDSVNREHFCPGDRFRVRAKLSAKSVSVEAKLFVNGDFYDNEIVYVSGSKEIIFDRIIDSEDWINCRIDPEIRIDLEIRVVAEAYCGPGAYCGSDEKAIDISFDDWCCEYDKALCECWLSEWCSWKSCDCFDYGSLRVRVTDCKTGEAIQDATVTVNNGVKITHYNGYARFTLHPGSYTVTVNTEYAEEKKTVDIFACESKTLDICLSNCEEGYTTEVRCFGPYVQKKYVRSDCTEDWKIVQYCESGCIAGSCLPVVKNEQKGTVKQKTEEYKEVNKPLFVLDSVYEIKPCKVSNFSFTVVNLGPKREFKFMVTGAKELIYVPHSLMLEPGENTILAYAYMCEPGEYKFSIKAVADGVASTSSSVLRVSKHLPLLDAYILSLVVIVIVLLVLKRILPTAFSRVRKMRAPEEFI